MNIYKIIFVSNPRFCLMYSRFISHLCLSLSEEKCEIKELNPQTREHRRRDNYQDETGKVLTQQDIIDITNRLNECKQYDDNAESTPCCGKFNMNNNCEHTVTYIRYGISGRVSCLVL